MRFVRPSMRRMSVLDSIAESSASSSMSTTPPMKLFKPRRATITSFGVNIPVNQRPSRRTSLSEASVSTLQPPRRSPCVTRARAATSAKPSVTCVTSSTPRRESSLKPRARPTMSRCDVLSEKLTNGTGSARPRDSGRRRTSVAAERVARTSISSATATPSLSAMNQSGTGDIVQEPSKRRRLITSDNVPSYARPTAASQAKMTRKSALQRQK